MRSINNIGKKITAKQTIGAEVEITQAVESGDTESDAWNWVLRKRKSDVTYEYDDTTEYDNAAETLDTLDRQEKINVIEDYISETISKRLGELPIDQRKQFAAVAMKKLDTEINKLDSLSDDAINKRYLIAAKNMSTNKSKINDVKTTTKYSPI